MNTYAIRISEVHTGGHEDVSEFHGTSYEAVAWLREQIKWLRKEPYMVQRLDGEEPLEGLG